MATCLYPPTHKTGLSNPHICTQRGSASFYVGGSLIRCSKPRPSISQVGGGVRGIVKGFSSASRRRMLYTMGKIFRANNPLMITLTYPGEFSLDGRVWKNDLRKWFQRLKRRFPSVGLVWKLEPQKRGAPHFHILAWGLEKVLLVNLRSYVSKSWYEVVGSGDIRHLKAGTQVQMIRSNRGFMAYASKYIGKMGDGVQWEQPGRYWGIKGAEFIPWADLCTLPLTMRECIVLLRLMRRAIHCKRGNLPGLSILSNSPEYWFIRMEDIFRN